MKLNRISVAAAAMMLALVAVLAGCSRDNPIEPAIGNGAYAVTGSVNGEQLNVQVKTCDQLRLMFTVEGRPDTIVANQICEVIRVRLGQEEQGNFGDIHPGDSVQVFGERRQENYNYVYAYRLRVSAQEAQDCQLAARVRSTDRNRLMITFSDKPDTAVAVQHCEVSRQCHGFQYNTGFDGIKPGDSVQLYGERNQNGYLYANHIKICPDDPGGRWDVVFKDTIATIDYAQGTLTVNNRTELITIDESTVIRTVKVVVNEPEDNGKSNGGASLGDPPKWGQTFEDSLIAFTDLAVGDVITVHASFVDEQTLLAACITLADCDHLNQKCVTFEAVIATLDVDTRAITFEGLDWAGTVCNGAQLTGVDGEELTLADFAVGELVAVKGFPETETDLRISQMEKL